MHSSKLVSQFFVGLFVSFGIGVAHSQPTPQGAYIGIVIKANNHKVGDQFTFANLQTQRPFVTYPSGNGNETVKVFEDDETVVLIFVARLSGSTETFYLNKKRNRFTLVEVGALEATATGSDFRPETTYGALR